MTLAQTMRTILEYILLTILLSVSVVLVAIAATMAFVEFFQEYRNARQWKDRMESLKGFEEL